MQQDCVSGRRYRSLSHDLIKTLLELGRKSVSVSEMHADLSGALRRSVADHRIGGLRSGAIMAWSLEQRALILCAVGMRVYF
jgi:hypothetical protein